MEKEAEMCQPYSSKFNWVHKYVTIVILQLKQFDSIVQEKECHEKIPINGYTDK